MGGVHDGDEVLEGCMFGGGDGDLGMVWVAVVFEGCGKLAGGEGLVFDLDGTVGEDVDGEFGVFEVFGLT